MKNPLLGVIATAALALAMSVTGTNANAKQASEWTCQDFIDVGDEIQPRVVYWMEGFKKAGKPEFADVGVEDFDRPIAVVVDECKREPKATLWEKIKKVFSKL